MSLVKELFLLTQVLYKQVSNSLPQDLDERDRYMQEIESYLSKRAVLLDKMKKKKEFSETEQVLGHEMVKMNERIHGRLNSMKGKLRLDLQQLQKKRSSHERYESPYEGPTLDGVFFDKKN